MNLLPKRSDHTVEKIGGTSISNTAAVVENVLIGGREGSALYNRIFVWNDGSAPRAQENR